MLGTSQLLKCGSVSACSLPLPICWDVVSATWIILWTWYDLGPWAAALPGALVISNCELLHVACRSKMFQDALPCFWLLSILWSSSQHWHVSSHLLHSALTFPAPSVCFSISKKRSSLICSSLGNSGSCYSHNGGNHDMRKGLKRSASLKYSQTPSDPSVIMRWSTGDQRVIHLVRIERNSSMSSLCWTTRRCTSSAPLSATFAPGQRVSCKTKVQFSNYLRFLEFLGYPKYPRAVLNGPWFSYVLHRPTLVGTSRSAMTSHSIILLWKDFIRSDLRHFTGRLTQTKQQETCPRVKHPMSSYISFLRCANSGHHCGFRTLPGECINFIITWLI